MFKSKIDALLLTFVAICFCVSWMCIGGSKLWSPLLPVHRSAYPLSLANASDASEGGASIVTVDDDVESLDYTFRLDPNFEFSYASAGFILSESADVDHFVDWTSFSTLKLTVRCNPLNVLSFVLYTFDSSVSTPHDFSSLRPSTVPFSCAKEARTVDIDLRQLNTPEWWLTRNGLAYSNKNYSLQKVYSVGVVNSAQSPVDALSRVTVTEVTLMGRNGSLLYVAYALWGCALFAMGWYLIRLNTTRLIADIKRKVNQNQPPISYQQLAVEPRKDRDKNAVLGFMSKEYANPVLSLDLLASTLGINRTKINSILKEHQGLTFSSYVNKLRLTEAARLLLDQDASVAEIAYLVGYNNASYFNRMFKKEYGFTPNAFKKHMSAKVTD